MIPLSLRPPEQRRPGVISVTLPSRRRPGMLARSIGSLRETAARPDLIEVLVAYDPDDPETAGTARELHADVIWEAPERYGYARSAHYYAALLNQASGEWSLPTWGDDGIMRTVGWDLGVRAQPRGTVVWADGNIPGMCCFPAVHMDAFAALGRLTPLPAIDHWFMDAARWAGVMRYPWQTPETDRSLYEGGFYVFQDRYDLTGNNGDQVYREGRDGYRVAEFLSDEFTALRQQDAATLRQFAEEIR